jgi:hypothetical protein
LKDQQQEQYVQRKALELKEEMQRHAEEHQQRQAEEQQ